MPEPLRAPNGVPATRLPTPAPLMATDSERESIRRPLMLTIADRGLIHEVLQRAFDEEEPLYALIHVIEAIEATMCPNCSGTGVLSPQPGSEDLQPCGLCAGSGWRGEAALDLDPFGRHLQPPDLH
jgi:hypothetical protein